MQNFKTIFSTSKFNRLWLITAYLFSLSLISSLAFAYPITNGGQQLATFLDGMQVENHWLANQKVYWKTGEVDPRYWQKDTYKSHGSAFVAAVAYRLNIYILRPPLHKQMHLAKAQNQWFIEGNGSNYGWQQVVDMYQAQQIANNGCLVVVSYATSNLKSPAYIAIIRPSNKPKQQITNQGPQIIQAGINNYNSIPLYIGFASHINAIKNAEAVYFSHDTPFCTLSNITLQ